MEFVEMIPLNVVRSAADPKDALGLILFAILVGVALTLLPAERGKPLTDLLAVIYEVSVKILGFAMALAPIGVAGLTYTVSVKLGFPVMKALGYYLIIVLSGLLFHQFVVLGSLVSIFCRVSPIKFFMKIRGLMVTAFTTSSSNATLPVTIRTCVEDLGVPQNIAGFVLPLGATMNMNGTALFEGVLVLFLAQVAGVDLSLSTQVVLILLCVLTAVGAAGVPGGALPLIALVLEQVGVPPGMLALVIGVDRIVDMSRTVPNVTSDAICAAWLARREGAVLRI